KIAAMHEPFRERRLQAFARMPATQRNVEGAGVSVEIWKATGHFRKHMEIFGIGQPTFGAAMRGDHCDPAFERQCENARIRVFGFYDWKRMFAAGMGEER